jgi:nitrate reductase NapD
MHVAGVIVHARPGQAEAARQVLEKIELAEIHASSGEGKLVVTLLGETRREVADALLGLEHHKPILNATLVYEESDSDFFAERQSNEN